MTARSLARSGQEFTTESLPGYCLRGLGLFELHREEILESYQGAGRWLVPSGTAAGKYYEVQVGTRRERDRCECIGFGHHGHCSHVEAAGRAASASAVCDACGIRVWWTELRQVEEDDGLLSFYPGDLLCSGCVSEGRWS